MKRYLLILSAGFICLLSSCNSKVSGGMSEKAKKNLETAHAVVKMFEADDYSKMSDYFAADVVDHAGMKGDVIGIDSLKASFVMYSQMMSEMKNETVKELADDDYVFQWIKQSWTNKVDGWGMKAGEKGTMDGVEVTKYKDGKITEHWGFMGSPDVMKMMSKMGNMGGGEMPADTTTHM